MDILRSIDALRLVRRPVHLAIGVFDGLHLGHLAVIERALASSRETGGSAVVVTFHPHPIKILRPEKAPRLLTSTQHKIKLIESSGVDSVLILEFTKEFSKTPPRTFIEQLVGAERAVRQICVGEAFTFGVNRSGSVSLLRELSKELSFELTSVAPVIVDEKVVSSTLIRSAVEAGDLESAARLLGRPFTILGTVSEGRQLGRQLGFPTANLRAHNEQFPPNGVYAARAWFRNREYGGVVNIGVRPTIENESGERLLELHLFDFDEEIYGQDIEVAFLEYLRPEQKFPDLQSLQSQIQRDAEAARRVCRTTTPTSPSAPSSPTTEDRSC
jgi:riboflavin kinase/FMN adenylyltransferase